MYVPSRKKEIKKMDIKYKIKEKENNTEELSDEIKEKIKEYYIDNSEFNKILNRVSVSQIERFASLLKDKKYSLKDEEIKKLVDEQIERFKDELFDPKKANGEFYQLFKAKFMNDESEKNNIKTKFLVELMKKYVRYNAGKNRIIKEVN